MKNERNNQGRSHFPHPDYLLVSRVIACFDQIRHVFRIIMPSIRQCLKEGFQVEVARELSWRSHVSWRFLFDVWLFCHFRINLGFLPLTCWYGLLANWNHNMVPLLACAVSLLPRVI